MTVSSPEPEPVEGTAAHAGRIKAVALSPVLVVAPVALACALGLLAGMYSLSPEPMRVEVDMSVSAGATVALYVNDLTRQPMIRALVLGERRKYLFDGIVEDITMLRVDPTDSTGAATVDLHSIVVVGPNGIAAQFGPQALAGWFNSGLAVTAIDETALHIRTTTSPLITSRMAIPLVRKGGPWTRWLPMMNGPDITWRLAAISLVLLLIGASIDQARRLYVPIAAAAFGLVVSILVVWTRMPDGPASAAVAVSRATFLGLSTWPALSGSIALIVGATLIGAAASLIDRWHTFDIEPARLTMRPWQVLGGLAALAVLTSPGLPGWASITSTRQYVPNWDSDMMVYWASLVHRGYLPLRDFWHPYGGSFVFDLPFPTGPALRWLYEVVLFGVFFVALGMWRGPVAASLVTALLLLGERFGMLPAMERYLLAVNVVLAYVVIRRDVPGASSRILFWCACVVALFIEPPQLVYAGVPIGLMVAADLVQRWRTDAPIRGWLVRRLGTDFGAPMVSALVMCGFLAMSGQLPGFLMFYGRLGDSVAYSAWPTGLPALDLTGFPRALFVFACSAILMAIGAYEHLAGGVRRAYGQALFGVGLVSLMVLQKHFMRWMDEQLFLLAAMCVMVLGVYWPGRRRLTECVLGGAILGAIVATLAVKPTAAAVGTAVSVSSARALSDLTLLTHDRAEFGAVNTARFAPERFDMFVSERKVIEWLRAHAGPAGDVRVFGLTDEPILCLLTGQPPPWIANLYDASPAYQQARMVRWLREEQPPFAVFDAGRLMFDGFQKVVRVPLVFSEVVYSYVPSDVVGRFNLLHRREPAAPLAMPYWRDRLGSDVDVGRLASVSSFADKPTCSSAACGDVLEVEVPAGGSGRVSVQMTVADLSFSLTFTRVPRESAYRVLLDRVWFWNVAKRAGLPHAVTQAPTSDVRINVRSVGLNEAVLY